MALRNRQEDKRLVSFTQQLFMVTLLIYFAATTYSTFLLLSFKTNSKIIFSTPYVENTILVPHFRKESSTFPLNIKKAPCSCGVAATHI